MGISKADFRDRDIFIDYPIEGVQFRFDHQSKRFFGKFYGKFEEAEVPHDNDLLNEAMRFGDEIDAASYRAGKPRA